MARIKKLTTADLKRIISEEKRKLRYEKRRRAAKRRGKRIQENSEMRDIRLLKLIKEQEIKAALKFKKLYELKARLKKKIIRDI